MGIEVKYLAFVAALGCAGWALVVSGMAGFDEAAAAVEFETELGTQKMVSPFQSLDKFKALEQVLNVVLPVGIACIAFLLYTYNANPIGAGSLVILFVLFGFAAVAVFDVRESMGEEAAVELSQVVWWMSSAQT